MCEYTDVGKILYDWQSLVAGVLAFGAGLLAYRAGLKQANATRRAATEQVEVADRAKRLQMSGIAVAVDLGFRTLQTDIKRAQIGLMRLKKDNPTLVGQTIMAAIQSIAKIITPPMLETNVDNLFMLGNEAGPLCLSLIHMLYEHDVLVDGSMQRAGSMNRDEWPKVVDELDFSLKGLDDKLAECKRAVQPIRDIAST